jgi:hypothetical protein
MTPCWQVPPAADPSMLQPGEEVSKRGDFVHWSEVMARAIAKGSRAFAMRRGTRSTASAWASDPGLGPVAERQRRVDAKVT